MTTRLSKTAGLIALLCPALAAIGCTATETETRETIVYTPYAGDPAYPNERPQFTMPAGDLGVTSDNGSDTVTLIDFTARELIGAAPVGRDPIDIDGPHHISVDRAAGFAYLALAYPVPAIATGPHASHGGSERSGFVQKLDLADLAVVGEVRVDTNPGDIVMSDDGRRLVVSHFELAKALKAGATLEEKRSNLAIIDTSKLTMVGAEPPLMVKTCIAPHGLTLSRPDAAVAYAACYGEDAVAIVDIDAAGGPVVTRVPIGPGAGQPGNPSYGPYAIVMTRGEDRLAVSNTLSRDVRFYDVASGAMTSVLVPTLGEPYFVAFSPDDATMYVPTQGPDQLIVVATATGATIAMKDLGAEGCERPHEAMLSTDASALYVVCEGDHVNPGVVLELDPATLDVTKTYDVGVYPDRLLVVPAP